DDIAGVYLFMAPFVVPHPQTPPVSSNPGCGLGSGLPGGNKFIMAGRLRHRLLTRECSGR
ncbi:MAG: hypothetical protein ACLQPD_32840, partial [Desulfomonilaceae bacterium]